MRAYSILNIIYRRLKYYYSIIFTNWREKRIEKYLSNNVVEDKPNKKVLPRVVLSVGNFCSLKCKECSQMEPYKKNHNWENINLITKELDTLFSVVDVCLCIDVIGGEPFLYNELPLVIEYLLKENKVKRIEITTNGTVPISDSLLKTLLEDKNKKIVVKLSNYGVFSKKISEIVTICKNNNIQYEILEMKEWYGFGNSKVLDGCERKSPREARYQYYWCDDNFFCKMIKNGKIYMCGRASGFDDLGIALVEGKDYLTLDASINYDSVLDFWKRESAHVCQYCGDYCTDKMKIVNIAEQLR